jgi:hypothetical protein
MAFDCPKCWEAACECPDGAGWRGYSADRLLRILAALNAALFAAAVQREPRGIACKPDPDLVQSLERVGSDWDPYPGASAQAAELVKRVARTRAAEREWRAAAIPCTTCGAVIGWHDPERFPRSGILSATCATCAAEVAPAP